MIASVYIHIFHFAHAHFNSLTLLQLAGLGLGKLSLGRSKAWAHQLERHWNSRGS
jgi:hypothetical protein